MRNGGEGMSRYIDADALIMALRLEYPMMPMFKENQEEWGIKTEGYRKAEEVIKDAPSIDIEPKQGKWIDMGDFEQCSACKGTRLKEFQSYYGKVTWVKTPYCPNCGAEMREREGE